MKPDISDLKDIIFFVDEFYAKVQKDDLIGPIFDNVISDWKPHLEKMYNFWNAALFGVVGFSGNPFSKHVSLPISKPHFDRWRLLFDTTIDDNFEGKIAMDAKNRAELMAYMFLTRMGNMTGGSDKVIV